MERGQDRPEVGGASGSANDLDVDIRIRLASAARRDEMAIADSSRAVTWTDLDRSINKIANALTRRGLGPDDAVAFLGANSVLQLELMLGALRAGICIVPLSSLSSAEVRASMIADSGSKLLFVSDLHASEMREHLSVAGLDREDVILIDAQSIAAFTSGMPETWDAPPPPPEQAFNLIYSSGTTGIPKGIIQSRRYRATESEKVIRLCGLGHHSLALISTPLASNTTLFLIYGMLAAGGSIWLMEKFDEARWLQLADEIRPTDTVLVPVQYTRLLDHPHFDAYGLSSFRNKLCTSAPLSARTKAEILERWPAGGFIEFYGMTEGGIACTLVAHENRDKLDTVGRPSIECDLRVVDENGRELPTGEAGEIVGWSPTIMSGYHKREAATLDASWFDGKGRRFQRSGDIGWIDADGFVHLKDRKKDVIISGGFNLYAVDLETVLAQHPSLREIAVVGAPSRRWGETPVAFVAVRDQTDGATLRRWANERLGKAQRLSDVIVVDNLPRSPIGKVLKRDLRDRLKDWQPRDDAG